MCQERGTLHDLSILLGFAMNTLHCLTICGTIEIMPETITFRPDEDAARALAELTRDGTSASSALRAALIAAARERVRAGIRAEAVALAADAADRAEAAQVLRDMETLRAW